MKDYLKLGEVPLVHVVAVYEISPWSEIAEDGAHVFLRSTCGYQLVPLVLLSSTTVIGCKKSMSRRDVRRQRLIAAKGASEILSSGLKKARLPMAAIRLLNNPEAIAQEITVAPRSLGQFGERSKWLLQRVAREWLIVVDPIFSVEAKAL